MTTDETAGNAGSVVDKALREEQQRVYQIERDMQLARELHGFAERLNVTWDERGGADMVGECRKVADFITRHAQWAIARGRR